MSLLDDLACKVGGHIWIQANDLDGVMTCTRCKALAEQPSAPPEVEPDDEAGTVIPEDRPWLDKPFTP